MLIDTHVHIGGDLVGFTMSEETVANMLIKYHIDHILLSNADSAEVSHTQEVIPPEYQVSQTESLKRSLKFARKHPGKIFVAPWVKPLGEVITPEFEELIQSNLDIIKAIKIHPFHSGISPLDPKAIPYLKLADKYGLAVVSHTGTTECDAPKHLYEAALMFPDIPFVMVHMGLGSDNREALDLLGKADNLYGDTTWVPMSTTIEAVTRYGSGKIMFGSDSPIDGLDTYLCNPKGERSIYQDYFHTLPGLINEEQYRDIMYRNAIRILKLNI